MYTAGKSARVASDESDKDPDYGNKEKMEIHHEESTTQ